LVALGPCDAILGCLDEVFALFGENDGFQPDGQVFKTLVRGHGFFGFLI
jgi:hypothetical protein